MTPRKWALVAIVACAIVAEGVFWFVVARRAHPAGLQGNVISQERALLLAVGMMGIVLLVSAFVVGSIASPSFLAELQHGLSPLGQAYEWLISVIATVAVFLLTPLFWLLSLLPPINLPKIRRPGPPPVQIPPPNKKATTPEQVVATIAILKVVLPVLLIVALGLLIWWALRRRRVVLRRRAEDFAESLWSWELFWTQLKAFFLALWRRFFPLPVAPVASAQEEIAGTPTARSIREIYRAMLRWAAGQGHPRKRDETPYEFRQRLDERMPLVEPELSIMTDAYAAIRYGGATLDEADLALVQRDWQVLQQKAQAQTQ